VNSLGSKALFGAAVALLDGRLVGARGWVIHGREFPLLDISFRDVERVELRLQLACDDWNDTPPSVTLCSADGTPFVTIPPQRPGNAIFNGGAHQRTGRPFVCMIGIREYHDHPSHVADLWSNYRSQSDYTLGGILDQLWRGWRSTWP
jgi:hypothetical protein